jgi:hypothetical protein
MTYRILTENVGLDKLAAQSARFFDSFTVVPTVGYWRGERESSAAIEIIGAEADAERVRELATTIKQENQQQAVLVERIASQSELI